MSRTLQVGVTFNLTQGNLLSDISIRYCRTRRENRRINAIEITDSVYIAVNNLTLIKVFLYLLSYHHRPSVVFFIILMLLFTRLYATMCRQNSIICLFLILMLNKLRLGFYDRHVWTLFGTAIIGDMFQASDNLTKLYHLCIFFTATYIKLKYLYVCDVKVAAFYINIWWKIHSTYKKNTVIYNFSVWNDWTYFDGTFTGRKLLL